MRGSFPLLILLKSFKIITMKLITIFEEVEGGDVINSWLTLGSDSRRPFFVSPSSAQHQTAQHQTPAHNSPKLGQLET